MLHFVFDKCCLLNASSGTVWTIPKTKCFIQVFFLLWTACDIRENQMAFAWIINGLLYFSTKWVFLWETLFYRQFGNHLSVLSLLSSLSLFLFEILNLPKQMAKWILILILVPGWWARFLAFSQSALACSPKLKINKRTEWIQPIDSLEMATVDGKYVNCVAHKSNEVKIIPTFFLFWFLNWPFFH